MTPAKALDAQIRALALAAGPDAQAVVRREGALQRINAVAEVHAFGSTATGLALPTSDLDLVLATPSADGSRQQNIAQLRVVAEALGAAGLADASGCEVVEARVPIVRFVERASGMSVDLSCWRDGAEVATMQRVGALLSRFPAARPLLLVLKVWMRQQGLADTYEGGLGSHLLLSMLLPVLQGEEAAGRADAELGALLLAWFARHASTDAAGAAPVDVPDATWDGTTEPPRLGSKCFRFRSFRIACEQARRRLEAQQCLSAVLQGWPEGGSVAGAAQLAAVLAARAPPREDAESAVCDACERLLAEVVRQGWDTRSSEGAQRQVAHQTRQQQEQEAAARRKRERQEAHQARQQEEKEAAELRKREKRARIEVPSAGAALGTAPGKPAPPGPNSRDTTMADPATAVSASVVAAPSSDGTGSAAASGAIGGEPEAARRRRERQEAHQARQQQEQEAPARRKRERLERHLEESQLADVRATLERLIREVMRSNRPTCDRCAFWSCPRASRPETACDVHDAMSEERWAEMTPGYARLVRRARDRCVVLPSKS